MSELNELESTQFIYAMRLLILLHQPNLMLIYSWPFCPFSECMYVFNKPDVTIIQAYLYQLLTAQVMCICYHTGIHLFCRNNMGNYERFYAVGFYYIGGIQNYSTTHYVVQSSRMSRIPRIFLYWHIQLLYVVIPLIDNILIVGNVNLMYMYLCNKKLYWHGVSIWRWKLYVSSLQIISKINFGLTLPCLCVCVTCSHRTWTSRKFSFTELYQIKMTE